MSNSAIDSRQKLQSTYQFKSSSVFFLVLDAVLLVSFGRIVRLPARRWKDVLVPLVPTPQENFSCMRFVFFNAGIVDQSNIIVNVEAEQRSTFTPGLSHDEIVERIMMRYDEILFHVHQLIRSDVLQLVEVFT